MTQFLVLAVFYFVLTFGFPVKHLAGPVEEFTFHRVPSPEKIVTTERSVSDLIWFDFTSNGQIHSVPIPVDSAQQFTFSFASPFAKQLELELIDPSGKVIDITPFLTEDSVPIGDSMMIPTSTYVIQDSVVGYYTLHIKSSSLSQDQLTSLAASSYPNAILIVFNNDNLEIESHMSSYLIKQGQEIGIISTIADVSPELMNNIRVTTAFMEIITPSGKDIELPMVDDDPRLAKFGIPPHSGVYGAHMIAEIAGEYVIQAKLEGVVTDSTTNKDIPFLRSTQHVVQVSSATVELTGIANLRPLDKDHVLIDIGTTGEGDQLRAYAEVWGVDSVSKEPKAACWIGGVVQIINNFVTLELDTKWLQLAGVNGPLTLKNVYVSDLQTSFPVAIASKDMSVQNSATLKIKKSNSPIQITKEMRFGVNPLRERYQAMRNVTAAPTLLMLPGYCSSTNPWQGNQKDFTDAVYFNSGGGNLLNHDFARRALDYVDQLGLTSYSIIGHSQGGMVALHIHNYFFTGLDMATNGRILQSVGTPFRGCTAAGVLADLGKIFGIACGSNTDLSVDGAANWLSGISYESIQSVHHYTTTYKQGNLFGDYCNLPINLVLKWPNDGTTEIAYAILSGATNWGNKEKWCHTGSMKYPPQYTDSERNVQMNAAAAR